MYLKYFGILIKFIYNYKGYLILGLIFYIEFVLGNYVLYYDSDMFLY